MVRHLTNPPESEPRIPDDPSYAAAAFFRTGVYATCPSLLEPEQSRSLESRSLIIHSSNTLFHLGVRPSSLFFMSRSLVFRNSNKFGANLFCLSHSLIIIHSSNKSFAWVSVPVVCFL
jgi:hypothetical protein